MPRCQGAAKIGFVRLATVYEQAERIGQLSHIQYWCSKTDRAIGAMATLDSAMSGAPEAVQ